MQKNIKTCVVCGAQFSCSPSSKKITCGKDCSHILLCKQRKSRKLSAAAKNNMSAAAKNNISEATLEQLKKGTLAAQKSPLAGRFETNSSAKYWCLRSPEGMIYQCYNLNNFIRENIHLFNVPLTDENVNRISHGFDTIKRNIKNNRSGQRYFGWTILSWSDEKNIELRRKNEK